MDRLTQSSTRQLDKVFQDYQAAITQLEENEKHIQTAVSFMEMSKEFFSLGNDEMGVTYISLAVNALQRLAYQSAKTKAY